MLRKALAIALVGAMLSGCATTGSYQTQGPQPTQTGMTEDQKRGWALVAMIVVFGGLTAMSYQECFKNTAVYSKP